MTNPVSPGNRLDFHLLPKFASWILENRLEPYVLMQIDQSRLENVPLIKQLENYSDEELLALGKISGTELLTALAANKAEDYINNSQEKWLANRLEIVDKQSILAEDVSLISMVRRQTFRKLLHDYTSDVAQFDQIILEVDRFTTAADIAAMSTFFKIQQQKKEQMNALLEEQRQDLLEIQELAQLGSFYWDLTRSGKSHFSPNTLRIFELEKTSNLESFLMDVHPEDRDRLSKAITDSFSNGGIYECEYRYERNAKRKTIWSRGSVQFENEKPVAIKGTVMDVTHRAELVQEIREKEEYLHQLISNAPDAIVVIDEKSIIRLWNPKTEAIFGWTSKEVLGKHLADTIIPERYRNAHIRGIHRYLTTGESRIMNRSVELTAITKNNEEPVISLTLSTLAQNGQRFFIGFIRDITRDHETQIELKNKTLLLEQKNRELERTNEELESFNYVASHDLQEPLRKIQVFARRITDDKLTDDSRVLLYLDKINHSASRMQRLIDELLVFSQTTAGNQPEEEIEFSTLLTEASLTLAHRIEETGTKISHTLLPKLRVVGFQFQQVITNILSNSIKFRKENEPPRIWIGSLIVNGSEIGVIGQNFVKISFADEGIGFDPEFANRLFDLFSRLHGEETFSGTGIGLAICKKIVQNHQGYIRAESDGRSGATIHIYLPEERVSK